MYVNWRKNWTNIDIETRPHKCIPQLGKYIEWTKIKELKEVQEKYDFFLGDLRTRNQGIRSILQSKKKKKKKCGLTESVKDLKREEMKHGREWKENWFRKGKKEYKLDMNDYVRVRREEIWKRYSWQMQRRIRARKIKMKI